MPELPEVEHSRRLLSKYCQGKQITSVNSTIDHDEKVFDGSTEDQVRSLLKDKFVKRVGRKGKHSWFELSTEQEEDEDDDEEVEDEKISSSFIFFHQGMTGAFQIKGHEEESLKYQDFKNDETGNWPPKHCKLCVAFSDGTQMAMVRYIYI